ncbi:hypothetical protein GQ55_4G339600 [Panicum hallii var. hallii]|uniref:Uncharacterized protein n=1 Tax=Panicum hallii var. hallii TaxID=1504633 RepID=A0A2T7E305_9POAL|nr:hypothetical protein GQ55_4G339600 [Panicum hallii var. hallii]
MAQRDDAHVDDWLLVLTLSSGAAACRAAGDAASIAFVLAGYVGAPAAPRRAPPGEAADNGRKGRLRRAVWSLSTLLTVMFAWRVAAVMPNWPAALLVWALAAATTVGGFVALFHRRP